MCKIDINYVSLLFISVFTPLDALENERTTEQTVEDVHYRKDFPYQVSLHYSHNDEFICGGTIISSTVVLTAAHCMYYKWGGLLPPIIVTVSAGKTNLNETAWRNFDVDSITLHPLFNKTSMEYDLAVIEVNDQFPTSDVIGSVTVEKAIPEAQYNECFVTGWPQQSLNLELTEVVITTCYNYPERICTVKRNENETTCINEAGVPLICDEKLVGILSIEPDCNDPDQLTHFENVRNSMSWLNEFNLEPLQNGQVTFDPCFVLLVVSLMTGIYRCTQ